MASLRDFYDFSLAWRADDCCHFFAATTQTSGCICRSFVMQDVFWLQEQRTT